MENSALRYFVASPGNIFDICFRIVDTYGVEKAIAGKPISDYPNIHINTDDQDALQSYFKHGTKIQLSVVEALSMAYVATYYQQKSKDDKQTTYGIAVDIEDKNSNQTAKELYFSDGVLAINSKTKGDTITPFQQVIAQNIVGKNQNTNIEDEVIRQFKRKLNRRSTYNEISGLIVSMLPSGGSLDIEKVMLECNVDEFEPTFMVIFTDDMKTAEVLFLHKAIQGIDDLRMTALIITPQLHYNN
jgi:hypothetical protein